MYNSLVEILIFMKNINVVCLLWGLWKSIYGNYLAFKTNVKWSFNIGLEVYFLLEKQQILL